MQDVLSACNSHCQGSGSLQRVGQKEALLDAASCKFRPGRGQSCLTLESSRILGAARARKSTNLECDCERVIGNGAI